MNQPGMFAKVSRTGNLILPSPSSRLRIWPRETGSAALSRVSMLVLHIQTESGTYSWDCSTFREGVHLFTSSTAIGSDPSLSGHAITCRRLSLLRVLRHRVNSPQASSSKGVCLLFRKPNWSIFVRRFFPTATICTVGMCYTDSFGGAISMIPF